MGVRGVWRGMVGLVLAELSVAAGPAAAQSVSGVLLARGTDRPVELALVTLLDLAGDSVAADVTDDRGRFRLEAAAGGDYRLAATALGYRPTITSSVLELPEGSSMTLEFRIDAQPVEIGGLTVDVTSAAERPRLVQNGFVGRAQGGFGRFLTPADIEAAPVIATSDLLARTGRVAREYRFGGDRIVMRSPMIGYCSPAIWVDGVRIELQGDHIDSVVPLSSVYAVEIYRSGSEAPIEFNTAQNGCGVLVFWTRGG
ncbi:MAG: carboxypeptidase-like regulatory domain-containing protein [Longimicrobiales bacterium]